MMSEFGIGSTFSFAIKIINQRHMPTQLYIPRSHTRFINEINYEFDCDSLIFNWKPQNIVGEEPTDVKYINDLHMKDGANSKNSQAIEETEVEFEIFEEQII